MTPQTPDHELEHELVGPLPFPPHVVMERLEEVLRFYGHRLRDIPLGDSATARNEAHRTTLLRVMRRTAQARLRLVHGTYGRCETCRGPIHQSRLIETPWVEQCVTCEQSRVPGLLAHPSSSRRVGGDDDGVVA